MTTLAADGQARLRAVCDLIVPHVRDSVGRHEYDGVLPDLSPAGVRAGLARLGGAPLADPHDEAHLAAVERRLQIELGEVELHRRNPRRLLDALDLSVYDRDYGPAEERATARRTHLAGWPDAIDAALASLDAVSAPAAQALLPAVHGAAAMLDPREPHAAPALAAHRRLVQHLETCSLEGDPDAALGAAALTALLGPAEAMEVDLDDLARTAQDEGLRMRALLEEGCARVEPGVPVEQVVARLVEDAPESGEQVLEDARSLTLEVLDFTRERQLVEHLDGECLVQPSPPSRRWAGAMLFWAGPYEPDAPSVYAITPPDPSWPQERQRQWLKGTSRTTLPATTAHEVAPGHFAHGRALRRVQGDVRRTLHSSAFVEGWAHYTEELMVEEGFRADDPRFAVGVALKALMRVVRLRVSLGVHTGGMTVEQAQELFEREALLQPPAAQAEALRAVIDPTYGRYTTGKLAVLQAREAARQAWGGGFSLQRFHREVLALGAPPLGLLADAVPGGRVPR